MKTRHLIAMYLGIAGMVTLIAILSQIQAKLLAIAPWVLATILACLALVLVYYLHKLWRKFREDRLALNERFYQVETQRLQVEEQKQNLVLTMDQWVTQRYVLLSRIPYDANGNVPILVDPRMDVLPSQRDMMVLPPGQIASTRVQAVKEEQTLLQAPLPTAPRFSEIENQITENHVLICYNENGPVWGTVDDLLSSNIVGKPGRGKTVLLFFFTAQFLKIGAQVIAFDPHGSMIEIADYISYEHEYTAMEQAVPKVEAMVNARLQAFKQWQRTKVMPAVLKRPVLFMVDELPAISLWEKENKPEHSILALIQRIILESRKTRMYVMLSGQAISHKILSTDARDNLSSHFVFESTRGHASMAGLEKEEIDQLLPRLKGRDISMGRCVVSLARESDAFIGAISATSSDDLARIANAIDVTSLAYEVSEYDQETEEMPALEAPNKVTPLFQSRNQSKRVSYEEAVNAWNAGYMSKRKMATYLGITEWQAQAWCKRLNEEAQAIAEEEANEETSEDYAEAN